MPTLCYDKNNKTYKIDGCYLKIIMFPSVMNAKGLQTTFAMHCVSVFII